MQRYGIVTTVVAVAMLAWYGVVRVSAAMLDVVSELGNVEELASLAPRPQATIVYDRRQRPTFTFFVEQRVDVPLDSVSPHLIDAVLAAEDRRFWNHRGIDPVRIGAAAWHNLRTKRIVQGGSTITQQLARVSQLTPVRTYRRKIREAFLAIRLEQRYTKKDILQQYLNTIYFGEGLYGVEAASRGYFNKPASDLSIDEAALLAALVRSPSNDSPWHAPNRALKRRNLVLRQMARFGKITQDQLRAATDTALPPPRHHDSVLVAGENGAGQYFQEEIRRQLVAQFGNERVLRGGLRVYSTYDPALQRAAEQAIAKRVAQIAHANPRARDLQGSLVAIDPMTGDVLALVGGRRFAESSFNRATQARRQAGSAFKPILYAAALERGYGPGTLLRDLDTPILAGNKEWLPGGDREGAEYTVRQALRASSNRAAAQLFQRVGMSATIYYANRLGIESQLPMVPSLALGTGEVTLLELTAAYTAFANAGLVSAPRLVTHVQDAHGNMIWEAPSRQSQAVSPTTAFLMSDMLAEVVSRGSASGARALGFRLPAAGKTGTTDNFADTWFIGYTPHLVTGVWFGLDKPAPIMREGLAGVVAVPAWAQFMRVATAGARPDWYAMPPDVERVAVCRLSGARATDACRRHVAEDTQSDPGAYTFQNASLVEGEQPLPRVRRAARYESTVYEDLFPIGAVPISDCWVHSPYASPYSTPPYSTGSTLGTLSATSSPPSATTGSYEAPRTPMVDQILKQQGTTPVATTGTTDQTSAPSIVTTSNGTKLSIQRVVGPDGVSRIVVKQIR